MNLAIRIAVRNGYVGVRRLCRLGNLPSTATTEMVMQAVQYLGFMEAVTFSFVLVNTRTGKSRLEKLDSAVKKGTGGPRRIAAV